MQEALKFWRDVGWGAICLTGKAIGFSLLWLVAVMLFESFTPGKEINEFFSQRVEEK